MADKDGFGIDKKPKVGMEIKAKPFSKKMEGVKNLEDLRKKKTYER